MNLERPAFEKTHRIAVNMEGVREQRMHAVRRDEVLAQGVGRARQVHLMADAAGVWNDLLDNLAHLGMMQTHQNCRNIHAMYRVLC